MKKEQAVTLSNLIEQWKINPIYEIRKLETVSGSLVHFHQWTAGKQTVAAYEVIRQDSDTGCFMLFIDWHHNDHYYLVVYAHDKSTTLAELHQIEEIEGIPHFIWKYNPLKRDGKNNVRKAYFKNTFGSILVQIKLPASALEVESFFDQLFQLCRNRLLADRIVNVYDFDK